MKTAEFKIQQLKKMTAQFEYIKNIYPTADLIFNKKLSFFYFVVNDQDDISDQYELTPHYTTNAYVDMNKYKMFGDVKVCYAPTRIVIASLYKFGFKPKLIIKKNLETSLNPNINGANIVRDLLKIAHKYFENYNSDFNVAFEGHINNENVSPAYIKEVNKYNLLK